MAKELVIFEKIEKRLRKKDDRSTGVFPLTPTHRAELRQLRDRNIGDLRTRMSTIKTLKREEFLKKHRKKIEGVNKTLHSKTKNLNKEFQEMIEKITTLITDFKKHEEEVGIVGLKINANYNSLSNLRIDDIKRYYTVSLNAVDEQIGKLFDEKFGERFKTVENRLQAMLTQYEEAINFGDLGVVKELYYELKDGDKILDEISKIKV